MGELMSMVQATAQDTAQLLDPVVGVGLRHPTQLQEAWTAQHVN